MKKFLLSTTAAIALATSPLYAQSIAEQVISQLQAEGYDSIEVENGRTQIKVEAVRDGRKLEVIYDAVTGAILKQEVEDADDDDIRPGVRVFNSDEDDFLDDDDEDDNDDNDDNDDDEDDNDDDEDDNDDDNDDDEGDDD